MLINNDTKERLVRKLIIANTFKKRFLGLMTSKELPSDEGLILIPCRGVHTFFMNFPIDVLYLDKENRITEIFTHVKPWELLPVRKKTYSVIELPAGTIAGTRTKKGHRLSTNSP